MTGPTGLIPLFIILPLIPVTGPNQGEGKDLICSDSVHATVGEDVTLGCHESRPKELDVTGKSVEWTLNGTIKVLVYRSRDFNDRDQAKQFKGRASPHSSWNTVKGKLNVTISSVKGMDAGKYTCTVRNGSKRISCSTTLHVNKPESEKQAFIDQNRESTTTVNQAPNSMTILITTLVLAAAAVVYLLYH